MAHQAPPNLNDLDTYTLNDTSTFAWSRNPVSLLQNEQHTSEEKYDFPALLSCTADLYIQKGVLDMQSKKSTTPTDPSPYAMGATSYVSRTDAAFTQPDALESYKVKQQNRNIILKKAKVALFHPDGQPRDVTAARSFLMELRILSHPGMREWDYSTMVSTEIASLA
jgi:hypothetical protein